MNIRQFFLLLAGTLLFCSTAFADSGVGQVISIKPGGFAQRGGESLTLALQARVNERDILRTDTSGRMQIILDDDTTLSLAPSTQINLERVVVSGRNSEFKASITGGLARFITGKITERNPGAFTVTTPKGTVGIRGTIFSIQCDNNIVIVYVTNTTHGGVEVAGQLVPSGSKMILREGGVPTIVPMTAEESDAIDRQVANGIASGTIVASGKTTTTEGEEEKTFTVAGAGVNTGLTDLQNSMNNSMLNVNQYQPLQTGLAMYAGMEANMKGTFSIGNLAALASVGFALNVDLFSGASSGTVYLPVFGDVSSGGTDYERAARMVSMSNNIAIGLESAKNIPISGSVNNGAIALSGTLGISDFSVYQIDLDGIPASGNFGPITPIDVDYLGVSLNGAIVGNSNTIQLSGGTGELSLKYSGASSYSPAPTRHPNIIPLVNAGGTITTPITNVEATGPVTPKP